MKGFNLFQLSALKNTDYITADLQCIPGPLKYLKSMCAVVVARQSKVWLGVRLPGNWKTHRSLRYTLKYVRSNRVSQEVSDKQRADVIIAEQQI